MARPVTDRRVRATPARSLFVPSDGEGAASFSGTEVRLSLDEFEAIRLADFEGLYQEAAALRMGISRQTFGRIVEAARKKVAEALVRGTPLRVGGGNTITDPNQEKRMKIAVPTKEGNVDDHFGHCSHYSIFAVEGEKIVGEETLAAAEGCGCKSGIGGELARAGVQTMLAGNIGTGAVRVLGSFGIQVIRGASGPVKNAVGAYLAGALKDTGTDCAAHGHGHEVGHECARA